MSTLDFNWGFHLLFAFGAWLIGFVLLYWLEGFLEIFLSCKVWIGNSSPPFLFSPLKIPLLLPASLIIRPIMQINTTITKGTIPRIMPILTKSKVIVKPACIPNCVVQSRRTLPLPKFLLRIHNLILSQWIIGITIGTSIYVGIKFALLDLLSDIDVVHVLLFS